MKTFNAIVGFLLSFPVAIFGGYILSRFWSWFIAPKFGLPQLGVVESIGLTTTVGFVLAPMYMATVWQKEESKHEYEDGRLAVVKPLVTGLIIYPLLLAFGYMWSRFL